MNEQTLTLRQLEYVTGWSRPTATAFAQAHGHQRDDGRKNWFIPVAAVEALVAEKYDEVDEMARRLAQVRAGAA